MINPDKAMAGTSFEKLVSGLISLGRLCKASIHMLFLPVDPSGFIRPKSKMTPGVTEYKPGYSGVDGSNTHARVTVDKRTNIRTQKHPTPADAAPTCKEAGKGKVVKSHGTAGGCF